ncbi:hypothetical protein [Streptomyces johnsoniae]|uniref:Uncharacterized protein n=1 Tax=Streptomyces johnsoniae TaxID=3075532 RepID=A0ABU2SDT2_9ACTN|nr:hypothetical protein [Streptomyces sp. DSM 41886]MDT0447129.1 hypothetical protein [Streptomyces sp. DSM 41886]
MFGAAGLQAGNDVVDGEHDAADTQRVRRLLADAHRPVGPQPGDVLPDAVEPDDTFHPAPRTRRQ